MKKLLYLAIGLLIYSCGTSDKSEFQSLGDVKKIKQRPDGKFDVECKDGRKEVVSKDDIVADRVCQPTDNSFVVSGGEYHVTEGEFKGTDCKHIIRPIYQDKRLIKLSVKFEGKCAALSPARLECLKNSCKKDNVYTISFLSNTTYRFVDLKTSKVSKLAFYQPDVLLFKGIRSNLRERDLKGWKLCYKDIYYKITNWPNIMNNCKGKKIMIGCKKKGTDRILLAAIGDRDMVFGKTTSRYATRSHNGTGFYHYIYSNRYGSIGFAKQGDAVDLNYTDTRTTPNPGLRMSWYLYNNQLYYYGRCASTNNLPTSELQNYERFIYSANI